LGDDADLTKSPMLAVWQAVEHLNAGAQYSTLG
jgi:hypothetical protein